MLVLTASVSAATLHGNVYDYDLNVVDKAVVEIDTVPVQRFVATNGEYSFELAPGTYTVKAYWKTNEYDNESITETVTISKEGSFILDLIFFPGIEQDIIDEELLVDLEQESQKEFSLAAIIAFIVFLVLVVFVGIVVYYEKRFILDIQKKINKEEAALQKKSKDRKKHANKIRDEKEEAMTQKDMKEEKDTDSDDYKQQLLDLIKKEGGRTTQKNIRREIPLSEAKISLLITELEHKGKVKRIKKGRGNVIVLQ